MIAIALLTFVPVSFTAHADLDDETTHVTITNDVPGFVSGQRKSCNAGIRDQCAPWGVAHNKQLQISAWHLHGTLGIRR